MSDINPPTCLDINLEDHLKTRRGKPIRAETAHEGRMPMARYTDLILPGHKVEFTGRKELVNLWSGQYDKLNPSSLFFQSVHQCFAEHYPLALSPEVLWFLIMHEVATTVRLNPDSYREIFTEAAKGKTDIHVRDDTLLKGSFDNDWTVALELIRGELGKLIPGDLTGTMLPKLSTSTPETETACIVGLMDAASPFYDYHVWTRCGLPRIRLLGQAEDYLKLAEGALALAPLFKEHLEAYFTHLIPVLNTLAEQAHGDPVDLDFWKSAYKFDSGSGSDKFNGWLSTFVNYVQTDKGVVPKKDETYNWEAEYKWMMPGIEHNSVPSQVSAVPFTWHYYSEVFAMTFFAGPLGIEIIDGFVTPQLSYGVSEKVGG